MIQVIPAIDILNGQVVRLIQGDYSSSISYYKDPVDIALLFRDNGISRIHMVDLDGAKASHIVNYRVLERVAGINGLHIDFGGGLKTNEDLRIAFESGAEMITGGSIAIKDPELFLSWLEEYGSERIILGADFRDGIISVSGWQESGEKELYRFVNDFYGKGIRQLICTDISRDGMMEGAAVGVYRELMKANKDLHLIASGGVGSVEDIEELAESGIPAVIVGRSLYEGNISLSDIQRFIP